MLLSNMGYAQEANVYDQTKEDLQGKKMILTTAEDWWNDTYQGIVDKYCEEFGVEMEVNILPAETASEVIKSQLCAQLRVCSQAGGIPVYPRFSQPDNSESWDDAGNGI